MSNTDEHQLDLAKIKYGDEDELRGFCNRLYPRLFAFVSARMPKSYAEDVVQSVFLKVYKNLGKCTAENDSELFSWAFAIARNMIADQNRSRRAIADECINFESVSPTVDTLVQEEQLAALRQCLEELSADERLIFTTRFEGENFDAISERTGLARATLYSRYSRARKKLQDCVAAKLSEQR